jgi:hypothetical protein
LRVVTRLLGVLLAVPLLAGCTVEPVGKAGIGVDAEGGLIGYIAVCDKHIDGATLYYDEGSATDSQEVTAGVWTSDQPVTALAGWSLAGHTSGWTTTTPLKALEADRTYSLYGWTHHNSGSAVDVSLTPAQLEDLTPGKVYFIDHYDVAQNRDVYAMRSPAEFRKAACRP